MIFFAAFFIEIFILFLLSRSMSKTLSRFMSINLISLVFLPGVIVHELSHFLVAVVLLVPVGDMEFSPKKNGNGVRLGSIEIGKTDPIRRSMVGFAPVFVGLVLVVGIVYLFTSNALFFQGKNPFLFVTAVLAVIYFLFAVSNTMFSSSRDMEGTAEILIALSIIFAASYLLGFRPSLSHLDKIFTKELIGLIQKSVVFLSIPIAIDLFILGTIRLITYSRSRIRRRDQN